jgi:hypothetical protein
MTLRDQAVSADRELAQVRAAIDEANAQADAAERARDAITVDAADLLARAEAQASGLLERANRDAEAIRQEAILAAETIAPRVDRPAGNGSDPAADETLRSLAERVGRLERKVAKQRRRLERLTGKRGANDARPKHAEHRRTNGNGAVPDVIAAAEREASEIRRAARRDRERFRAELVTLLSRFAPLEDDLDD